MARALFLTAVLCCALPLGSTVEGDLLIVDDNEVDLQIFRITNSGSFTRSDISFVECDLAPGSRSGTMPFAVDVVLKPNFTATVKLAGTETSQYDALKTSVSLDVAGNLKAQLLGGFHPASPAPELATVAVLGLEAQLCCGDAAR